MFRSNIGSHTCLESMDFEDTMGIMSDTGCDALDKKLNANICFKGGGGGGGSTTPTSTIPDEWKPFITEALGSAQGSFQAGDLAHVEGLNPAQKAALERQKASAGGFDKAADDYDATRDKLRNTDALKAAASGSAKDTFESQRTGAATGGNLGSARQQALEGRQEVDLSRKFADLDYKADQDYLQTSGGGQELRDKGTAAIGEAGKAEQAQGQAEGDAKYQAINRLFGLYGSAPFQSQQNVQKSGGGK